MPCKSMSVSVDSIARSAIAQSSPRAQSSSSVQFLSVLIGAAFGGAALIKAASSQKGTIVPALAARRESSARLFASVRTAATAGGKIEAIKSAALAAIAESPYQVETTAVAAPLERFARASSLVEVKEAHKELLRAVEASHTRVFAAALNAVVTRAVKSIGFTSIKVLPGASSRMRFIAGNADGRRLYGEVNVGTGSEPTVGAEVIGASHEESHSILDALDLALKEEGLRTRGMPIRKGAGGVLNIAPAQHHNHDHDKHQQAKGSASDRMARRAQRVNARTRQKQR